MYRKMNRTFSMPILLPMFVDKVDLGLGFYFYVFMVYFIIKIYFTLSPASEASREVDKLTERKDPLPPNF